MTENTKKIIEIEVSVAEAADMMVRATAAGVTLPYFAGIHALLGCYGALHPSVIEFRNRAKAGVSGPEIQEGEEG